MRDTFFFAFKKVGGSMTEKQMRKTSQWGYAKGRNRLYYYWPAVSLKLNSMLPQSKIYDFAVHFEAS
jgi:hypothetical protein